MTKEIPLLYVEMEKLLDRILSDFMSTLIDLSGNQTDIEPGTHIKIPAAAGYVKFYRSADSWNLSLWLNETLQSQNLNTNDET